MPMFTRRLKREAIGSNDAEFHAWLENLLTMVEPVDLPELPDKQLLPVLPLEIARDDLKLSLFTVLSSFGTAQDVTADELRVEAFYPGDTETEEFFKSMLNSTG